MSMPAGAMKQPQQTKSKFPAARKIRNLISPAGNHRHCYRRRRCRRPRLLNQPAVRIDEFPLSSFFNNVGCIKNSSTHWPSWCVRQLSTWFLMYLFELELRATNSTHVRFPGVQGWWGIFCVAPAGACNQQPTWYTLPAMIDTSVSNHPFFRQHTTQKIFIVISPRA